MYDKLLHIKNPSSAGEIERMQKEIERLKRQLKTQDKDFTPKKSGVTQIIIDTRIITTQKEVDGFNVIKRVIKNGGLDESRLHLKDTVEYCGINIDKENMTQQPVIVIT